MASSTEGRLENLEITVEGIKAETIAIRWDVQQIMRALGTQTNHHDGKSDDSSVNENQRKRVENQPEGQKQWWKQVTLPIFEGIDPLNWIYDAEIFFELRGAAEEEKHGGQCRFLGQSLEGESQELFLGWSESWEDSEELRMSSWRRCDKTKWWRNLLGVLKYYWVRPRGYQRTGLREEIKGQVRIQDPQDLMIAMRIARDVEDAINRARGGVWNEVKVNPVGTRPTSTIVRGDSDRHFATRIGGAEEVGTIIREGSTVASNTNPRGNTMEGGDSRGRMVRNLPYPEFLKRREEGRCFRSLIFREELAGAILGGRGGGRNDRSLEDGHKRTSRGPCEKIRINLGEATVEEELKLPIIDTPLYPVSQGDGHRRMTRGHCEKVRISFEEATLEEEFYAFDLSEVDAILGVAWLGKLGELLINWEEMTMVYYLEGKRIRISGHQAVSRQLVESKLTNVESWAIVWKRDQVEKQVEDEWQAELTGEQGAELQVGLQANYHVFQEKQGLLPLRDIQHRIPLKDAAMLLLASYIQQLIIFINEKSLNSLGKRVFGVYIQGNLVLEDFDIQGEAGGTGRPIVKTFNASFTHHTLKIHFYWAGKGTPGISTRGVYGPLVSANLVGEDEFGYMLADILK
ncbi:hypothetical protein V8G54_011967 [Vigna mungo]|uniref:Malectin domain-containing protein n=1 Tax=Vigna mungo TaxID=3915 RepID=A0AAQ3S3D3_VIGMU